MQAIRTVAALLGALLLVPAIGCDRPDPPTRKPAARHARPTPPRARPRPRPGLHAMAPRPEPRTRRGSPRPEPPRPSPPVAIPSALDLPLAEGVKPLTLAQAKKMPYLKVPLAQVVAHARASCKTLWFGVYLQSRKLGWGTMGCGVKKVQGREVLVEHMELHARLKTFGGTDVMRFEASTRYATDGKGELLYYRQDSRSNKERQTLTVVRRPDGWHTRRTYRSPATRKKPETRVLKRVRTSLTTGERAYLAALTAGMLPPGTKARFLSFDDDELKDADNGVQVLAVGTRQLRGVSVRIYKVETLSLKDKARGVALYDAHGDLLEGTFQGNMRIKREEKATAKRMDAEAVDFGIGLVIPARMEDVKNPAKVKRMRVELRGYLPDVVGTSPRQTLKRTGRDVSVLTVTRERLAGLHPLALPVRDPRLAEELKATHQVESDDPTIKALARKAAGHARTALQAAKNLNHWVFQNLKKSLSTNLDSALAIARARAGDCTEHSRLMVALCRAIGLPAREVGGVTWVPDLGGFGYHAWVEVYVAKDRWIAVDPSWDEVPANATHIYMGGPNDARWMGTLGTLKAHVLEVRKDR